MLILCIKLMGFPGGPVAKESDCQCRQCRGCRSDPWVGKVSWRRKWQLAPVFLPGKFHGQRSLASYSSNEKLLCNTGNSTQFSAVQEVFLFTFSFLSFPHTLCLFVVFGFFCFLLFFFKWIIVLFGFNSLQNWVTSEQMIKSLLKLRRIADLGKEKRFSTLVDVLFFPLP